MTSARSIGERGLIDRIVRRLAGRPDVTVDASAGDDCAVVQPDAAGPDDWLLTSDPLIEGVHFLPSDPPRAIGHKAVGRVLSDIAAMGGRPRWALSDLVAPPDTPVERIEAIYEGAEALARRFDLALVGGDVAAGPVLELHFFAVGVVPRGQALLRSGAKAGDAIHVTGELGGSISGKHLAFLPRIPEGIWLRESRRVGAMLDVSDGLALDLHRLCHCSGVGAELDASAIPASDAARAMSDGRSALEHALSDGEDFELLFTVSATDAARFADDWRRAFTLPCRRIGTIRPSADGIQLVGGDGTHTTLDAKGYEHFRNGHDTHT